MAIFKCKNASVCVDIYIFCIAVTYINHGIFPEISSRSDDDITRNRRIRKAFSGIVMHATSMRYRYGFRGSRSARDQHGGHGKRAERVDETAFIKNCPVTIDKIAESSPCKHSRTPC